MKKRLTQIEIALGLLVFATMACSYQSTREGILVTTGESAGKTSSAELDYLIRDTNRCDLFTYNLYENNAWRQEKAVVCNYDSLLKYRK